MKSVLNFWLLLFSYSQSATRLEGVKGIKILFTTEFNIDANGCLVPERRLNVRTLFFVTESSADDTKEQNFRGLSMPEMDEMSWSPYNLEGVSRVRLLEYAARLNIHEYRISGVATFDGEPQAINEITVEKLGRYLYSTQTYLQWCVGIILKIPFDISVNY